MNMTFVRMGMLAATDDWRARDGGLTIAAVDTRHYAGKLITRCEAGDASASIMLEDACDDDCSIIRDVAAACFFTLNGGVEF